MAIRKHHQRHRRERAIVNIERTIARYEKQLKPSNKKQLQSVIDKHKEVVKRTRARL